MERDGTNAAMAENPLNPNRDTMRVWGVLGEGRHTLAVVPIAKVSIGYLERSIRASSSRVARAYMRLALSCARPLALPDMLYAALSARSATFATHSMSSSNSFSDSVIVMPGGCLSLTIRCLRIESLRSE